MLSARLRIVLVAAALYYWPVKVLAGLFDPSLAGLALFALTTWSAAMATRVFGDEASVPNRPLTWWLVAGAALPWYPLWGRGEGR